MTFARPSLIIRLLALGLCLSVAVTAVTAALRAMTDDSAFRVMAVNTTQTVRDANGNESEQDLVFLFHLSLWFFFSHESF